METELLSLKQDSVSGYFSAFYYQNFDIKLRRVFMEATICVLAAYNMEICLSVRLFRKLII